MASTATHTVGAGGLTGVPGSCGMPRLAVPRVSREPMLPVGDGGGNGRVGGEVGAGLGVRNGPDIVSIFMRRGVTWVLKVTGGGWGQAL